MIYLDNAATSFPKPPSVIDSVTRCMRQDCGNPGRGSHELAMRAAERIFACRCEIASFFGSASPANVVFTPNATAAINLAIKGMLRDGDHVLISDMEHNAVFRPIHKLAKEGRINYDVFPTMVAEKDRTAAEVCAAIEERIRPNTRMLICAHASNICSAILPLTEIGALCRRYGILFVVDAAQSAGHIPIDVERMQIDALCAPGHKGLLGPQGSGFLLLGTGLSVDTLIEGGSGYNSLDGDMPEDPPERFEAGTLATPAITGLCEGIRTVGRLSPERIGRRIRAWNLELQSRLLELPDLTVYLPHHVGSILLFNLNGIPSDHVGRALNRYGICVRTGYHCSALGHKTLQTPSGGAIRVSPGITSTQAQIEVFINAIERIQRAYR